MSTEPITRWVPAIGQWEFNEPGRAVYLGPQPGQDRPFGICLSKSRFSEGEVRVTVQMPAMHPDISGRFGYRSHNAEYYTVGIGGNGFVYTLVHHQVVPDGVFRWRSQVVPIASSSRVLEVQSTKLAA
jgi:hypothetical protein